VYKQTDASLLIDALNFIQGYFIKTCSNQELSYVMSAAVFGLFFCSFFRMV
jgi:hypothetical protein